MGDNRFESPITPSVGRIILVRGKAVLPGEPTREVPGIVTRVWGQNCLNVQLFADGAIGHLTSVSYDADEEASGLYMAWRWMPYQVNQAAKQA
jgi:hypothetical protein